MGQWMEVWFEHYAKVKVRPSSHQTYRGYIDNHIKPNIGKIPLEKLTSLELQKFYKKLLEQGRVDRLESKHQAKGLSPKTVRNIHQIISSAMNLAREQKLITANPAEGCALPKAGAQGDENPAGGAAPVLPERGQGQRRVRALLSGAGHRAPPGRTSRPEVGGH